MASAIESLLFYLMVAFVPYALASYGIMISGRVGLFNVSGEGVMLLTASAAFLTTYKTGSYMLGFMVGVGLGALLGAIFTFVSDKLKINQFIVGLTLFIFATGLGGFLYKVIVGVVLVPPRVQVLSPIKIPVLSDIPIIGPMLFSQNILVYITIILGLLFHYILFKTHFGLKLRAVGDSPRVADVLGVNVGLMRYTFGIIGSALMGLAGAYLPLCFTGTFTETIVSGRGWIAIAITLFGRWNPVPIIFGSLVFSGVEVLVYWLQAQRVAVPYQFLLMLPFIVTLLILIYTSRRLEMPLSIGKHYDREAIEE